MTVVDVPCPAWFTIRVDAEKHLDGFAPVCAIGRRIEQPRVQLYLRAVIGSQFRAGRRGIFEWVDHRESLAPQRSRMWPPYSRETWCEMDDAREASVDAAKASRECIRSALFILTAIYEQHTLSPIGGQEDNARSFQCPSNLIARGLVYLQSALGFEAL
jgi:hypothetical protein